MLILNFTPFPELKTERLLLRRLAKTDAKEMYFLRSNEDVLRFLGRGPTKSIAEVEEFIDLINKNVDTNESILWGIALSDDPSVVIGTICFWNIKPEHYRGEIGYMLHPDHWRKGIMKEAINCVLDFGFNVMGFHSVEASLTPRNIASCTVLERTGFVKEGHFKENVYFNDEFGDTVIYSKLKRDHT